MSSRTSLQHSSPEFNDNLISKSIKSEKCYYNIQLNSKSDSDKIELINEKRDSLSTSSYKFLSWREKDRRRRFRDEWKHMWLVIPHGSFEVMCLVCHKVMTQRKLDTIKRHTVRRHTEVLDMDQSERILLFERLLLEHNSSKFPPSNPNTNSNNPNNNNNNNNNNCTNGTKSENGKCPPNTETEVGDLEKLLSTDCISATSSSSLSPLDLQQNNQDSTNYYQKRLKYNRKNMKINYKTSQKIDSLKSFSNIKSSNDEKSTINPKSKLKSTTICDNNKPFNTWSNSNFNNRILTSSNKSFHDSLYNLNGSSCLNLIQSMPMISKCPLCLEDCSQNGVDNSNTFNRLMNHMQQKHPEKLHNSNMSFDLLGGSTTNGIVQNLLMPPTTSNINYMSVSNAISSANMISFLYYQDLMRQTISTNRSSNSQFSSISSDPMFLQSPSALATSSIYPILSPPSPQYSLRPSSSSISAFNLNSTNDNVIPNPLTMKETNHIFNKISPLKRTKFSAESFISDSCSQSAFYSPKCCKIDSKEADFLKSIKNNLSHQNSDVQKFQTNEIELNNKDTKTENIFDSVTDNGKSSSNVLLTSSPYNDNCVTPKSSAQGNLTCHALRFGPGQDLKAGLLEYVKKKKISAAFIMTCCGSLNQAKLRMADSGMSNTPLEIKKFTKHFEIVSLVGSVFDHDCHLHISLSDSNGNVIGGHVIGDLIIHTTAEVMMGQICGVQMCREPDENTGYSELSFSTTDII